jgi:hypothetical protein
MFANRVHVGLKAYTSWEQENGSQKKTEKLNECSLSKRE